MTNGRARKILFVKDRLEDLSTTHTPSGTAQTKKTPEDLLTCTSKPTGVIDAAKAAIRACRL